MASANQQLLDAAIRHAHALERFKNGTVAKILGELNAKTYLTLVEELQRRFARIEARGFDLGVDTTKRLRDLIEGLDAIIEEGMSRAEDRLVAKMHGFAQTEAEVSIKQIERIVRVDLEMVLPSPETLRAMVESKPFSGFAISEHFENLTRSTQRAMRQALNTGLVAGESFEQITSRVRGTAKARFRDGALEMSRRQVRSVVGAAVQHVGQSARAATYKENADVIQGERWTSVLDSRTCPQCQALDGTVFPLGEGVQPPVHLGPCRCVRVPILKSWREMGLDLDDAPAGTRASLDGEVPEDETYGKWIARQSAAVQDEALGPERAALLRSGEVTLDAFTDDFGRLLTLEELRRAEGLD